MKKQFTFLHQTLVLFIVLLSTTIYTQNTPFNCEYNAYLFQYNDVYSIDLASGSSYLIAENITTGNINAAAYNATDGYIWGSLTSPSKTIVRIGKDFNTTTFFVDELPTNNRYIGDINANGVYYLKGSGTTFYKIDVNPNSTTYSQHLATETLSQNINIHDWAFNAVDNNLYSVEKGSNILYRINPTTNTVESLGEVPILSGLNYTYGAVYFDASGRFYVSANQTGTIYVIQNVQDITPSDTMDSNLFAFGPSSASNDGARCPTAPVAQEICDNGIDDDGDGLIDCEDPSCSGYGNCAVIQPPTSAGNDGGLESNNRLSEQINKRNYNRTKTNYKFDRSKAARVKKTALYKRRNNSFELKDFIPLEVINESETIETTPTDLLNITNATEIYAVDYMKNNTSVASILALKTENGVYEHTKYICDRLLGAELISVSTIEINNQQFIKSLIKNVDGTVEFVLSLSAKIVNNDTNFSIESHWNLDKYEEEVVFYNFQIWSNSLDDLYLLGKEVLSLLDTEKPITTYNNSLPPTVFVRKGKYKNNGLELQIINTNKSNNVKLDAGFRTTETSVFDNLSTSINLNENYITNLHVPTGNLFDIGFRIGDGVRTPDDLFISDGPWGIDDSQNGTSVLNYQVLPNDSSFEENQFPVERNIELEVITDTYFAAYRALTPRFKPIDLSMFNTFNLKASGNGSLEITFIKNSISSWNKQYKTTIMLTDNIQNFTIPFSEFKALNEEDMLLNDIKTIVFTMTSKEGKTVTKNMNLSDIHFSKDYTTVKNEMNKIKAVPNPISLSGAILFTSSLNETVQFKIYNQLGQQVYKTSYKATTGENSLPFGRNNLASGLYICKIISNTQQYNSIKLLVK